MSGAHWSVTVSRSGEELVTIETNLLSGRPEFSEADEDAIRQAGHHLLAFIGEPHFTPPPASGDREGLTDAILSATDKDGDQLFFAGHFNTRGAAAELLADAILAAGFKRGG